MSGNGPKIPVKDPVYILSGLATRAQDRMQPAAFVIPGEQGLEMLMNLVSSFRRDFPGKKFTVGMQDPKGPKGARLPYQHSLMIKPGMSEAEVKVALTAFHEQSLKTIAENAKTAQMAEGQWKTTVTREPQVAGWQVRVMPAEQTSCTEPAKDKKTGRMSMSCAPGKFRVMPAPKSSN